MGDSKFIRKITWYKFHWNLLRYLKGIHMYICGCELKNVNCRIVHQQSSDAMGQNVVCCMLYVPLLMHEYIFTPMCDTYNRKRLSSMKWYTTHSLAQIWLFFNSNFVFIIFAQQQLHKHRTNYWRLMCACQRVGNQLVELYAVGRQHCQPDERSLCDPVNKTENCKTRPIKTVHCSMECVHKFSSKSLSWTHTQKHR